MLRIQIKEWYDQLGVHDQNSAQSQIIENLIEVNFSFPKTCQCKSNSHDLYTYWMALFFILKNWYLAIKTIVINLQQHWLFKVGHPWLLLKIIVLRLLKVNFILSITLQHIGQYWRPLFPSNKLILGKMPRGIYVSKFIFRWLRLFSRLLEAKMISRDPSLASFL